MKPLRVLLAVSLFVSLTPATAVAGEAQRPLLRTYATAPSASPGAPQALDGAARTMPRGGSRFDRQAQWALPAVPGELIVGTEKQADPAKLARVLRAAGYSVVSQLPGRRGLLVSVPEPSKRQVAAELSQIAGVDFVEPNNTVRMSSLPSDARLSQQWGVSRVGAPEAWAVSTGEGVTIAIIDSGVLSTHADLAGRVDVVDDYDFVNDDADATDDNGHGTMIAGIAAASAGNRAYGAGVAPSATVLPLKVLDSTGAGQDVDLAAAIDYAVAHDADVINMSLGSWGFDSLISQAVADAIAAGVTVVAANGNDAVGNAQFPAWQAGVISVGASNRADRLASFSNWGPQCDLLAPGVGIMSTSLDGATGWADGTSDAAPFVAGAAALLKSVNPTSTPLEIAAALRRSAVDLYEPGWDERSGSGRLVVDPTEDVALPGGDEFEGDDTSATASLMTQGRQYDHALSPAGDVDWMSFDATAGLSYDVRTFELWGGSGGAADTLLELFDASGALLASNDNAVPPDLSSALVFDCVTSGRYYVKVSDPLAHGGGYGVSVSTVGSDEAESGVSDDEWANAQSIEVNRTYRRSYEPLDIDNVTFWVQAGKTYEILTDDRGKVDSTGWLFRVSGGTRALVVQDVGSITDPSPSPLENGTDPLDGNTGVRFMYTAPQTQKMLLTLQSSNNAYGGDYAVGVYESDARPKATRLAGADRYSTAAAIASRAFPGYTGVSHVIVACGEDRAQADAIAAAPLAGTLRAPILLTKATSVPPATASTIKAIAAANGGAVKVVVIGGTGSVPSGVFSALDALNGSGSIERIAGADRYAVSAAIARRVAAELGARGEVPPAVIVAAGDNAMAFYDALAISPSAYASTIPIVLVKRTSVPSVVSKCLTECFADREKIVVNGWWFLSNEVARAVGYSHRVSNAMDGFYPNWPHYANSGADRLRMAECVDIFTLRSHWRGSENVGLASKLPDALTGSVLLGEKSGGLLYSSTTALHDLTFSYAVNIYGFDYLTRDEWVLGGTASVPSVAVSDFNAAMNFLYWP